MTQSLSMTSRRERKKLQTRRVIREVALSLFEQYGYSNVTIEQITEAADVSPVTFYRHFGSKENVIISLALTPSLNEAVSTLAQARTSHDITTALDAAFIDCDSWAHSLWRRLTIITTTPELAGMLWQRTTIWVNTIIARLPQDLHNRIFIRCIISTLIECALHWASTYQPDNTQALRDLIIQEITPILTALTTNK